MCFLNENSQYLKTDILIAQFRNNKQFQIKQNYIHQNPVKSGFVINDYDYLYSSANEQGLLKIDNY